MNQRLMIVEDDLVNGFCALYAFDGKDNVKVGEVHGTVDGALKMIDEFGPTMALLDIHLAEKGFGTEVAKKLNTKNVSYLYVTGVGLNPSHDCIDAVEIQDPEFKTLERFEGRDKTPEIWKRAYEILKEKVEKEENKIDIKTFI